MRMMILITDVEWVGGGKVLGKVPSSVWGRSQATKWFPWI